jgi:hypothetical protein
MTNPASRADIMAWRKAERRRPIEERLAVDPGERRRRMTEIAATLSRFIEEPAAVRSAPIGRFGGNLICGLG